MLTSILRNSLVCFTLLCFTGCTTMRPLEDYSPSSIQKEVEVGDEVHVVTLQGMGYDLTVTKVESDALVGTTDSGKTYRIRYEAIRKIEYEEISGWKTAGGVVGGAVVVMYAIAVIATIALIKAADSD